MTITINDTFDGAAGGLVTARTGFTATAGYYDVLQVDGAGALKIAAYSDDPRSAAHNTGSTSNYVQVVVGAGFLAGEDRIALALSREGRRGKFELSYMQSTGLFRLRGRRDSSTQIIGTFAATLAAGDVLYFAHDAVAGTLEVKINGTTVKTETDLAYYNTPATNDVAITLPYDGGPEALDVFRSFEAGTVTSVPPADVTPPTLTIPTVTATGTTTVTGGITTNEAGPAWAILSTSATKPTAVQIKAGQNHTGVASPAATATLVVGTNPGVFAFSGLTPNTGYYLHAVQDDTTVPANTSTVTTSATVTTDALPPEVVYPIITLPVLKNNTGTLLADVVGATVHVYAVATGNKVVSKTGQTSNASAVMALTDPALVAGTEYRCVIVLASGAEGLQKATAV